MSRPLVIIGAGGSNLNSVRFAFERLGVATCVSTDADEIRAAERLVLPGVGAAAAAMGRLRSLGLVEALRGFDRPLLGICLGMQLLFEGSEEGETDCLALLPGRVTALLPAEGRPVPHTGWNRVVPMQPEPLLGRGPAEHYYFVHGFAAPQGAHVTAVADYGGALPAVVRRGAIAGVQFHPERSGRAGAELLARFAGVA